MDAVCSGWTIFREPQGFFVFPIICAGGTFLCSGISFTCKSCICDTSLLSREDSVMDGRSDEGTGGWMHAKPRSDLATNTF
ncbi:hypothetical protein CEXT_203851 [Caerostris extrusa]|uniref:Uncharacterized protein n=1 Tax=Caerostris extrusa TaxID=172846 RepID=A0AAV4Y1P2_CAEEX|nr:hypothetical protein CEXT_203851 [Caerostris extrusa]